MLRRTLCLLSLVLLLGSSACSYLKVYENPTAAMESVRLDEVGLWGSKLTCLIRVKNPNSYEITLSPVEYKVWVEGAEPVVEVDKQTYKFAGAGEQVIEVPMPLNYRRVLSSVRRIIQSDTIKYQLKGTAHVGVIAKDFELTGEYHPSDLRGKPAPAAEALP